MRLVTFNILHGRSLDDGIVDVGRFADAVRALDPDILALQEVDRGQPRSHLADLSAVAADAMGALGWRFVPAMTGEPGPGWVPAPPVTAAGAPAYGVALLSRYPVRSWRELRLPRIRPPLPRWPRDSSWPGLRREERRTVVVAQLDTPEGPLTVAGTHLSFVAGWGRLQLARTQLALAAVEGPVVILGDLNMSALLPGRLAGYRSLGSPPTYPADLPRRRIDRVLVRGDVGDVRATAAPRLPLSDHRALVVELDRSRLASAR